MRVLCGAICLIALVVGLSGQGTSASKQHAPGGPYTHLLSALGGRALEISKKNSAIFALFRRIGVVRAWRVTVNFVFHTINLVVWGQLCAHSQSRRAPQRLGRATWEKCLYAHP
jgi:hypothetical protein